MSNIIHNWGSNNISLKWVAIQITCQIVVIQIMLLSLKWYMLASCGTLNPFTIHSFTTWCNMDKYSQDKWEKGQYHETVEGNGAKCQRKVTIFLMKSCVNIQLKWSCADYIERKSRFHQTLTMLVYAAALCVKCVKTHDKHAYKKHWKI